MRSLTLSLLAAALLAVPASAGAVVVPQKSIMGVELQFDKAQVKAAAGEPDSTRTRKHEIIGSYTEYRYGPTRVGIADGSGVIFVRTTDRTERTANGAGVGTGKRELRRKLERERCKREGTFRHCYLGAFRPGRTVTDFRLNKRDRVKSITLAIVID